MSMKKLGVAIFALGALGSTAAKADSLYVGLDAGIANLSGDWALHACCPNTINGNISDSAFIGGVHAGFMHDFDAFALGLEGDLSFTNASDQGNGFDGSEGIGVDLNSLGSLRLRAGWNIDQIMPYITAGVGFGDMKYTQYYLGGKLDTVSDLNIGFVVGGGVEVKFAEVWSGRAEVLYYDFGNSSGHFSSFFPYRYNVDPNVTVVRVGISREFGM
jgi:outer membrane immunogenic protein